MVFPTRKRLKSHGRQILQVNSALQDRQSGSLGVSPDCRHEEGCQDSGSPIDITSARQHHLSDQTYLSYDKPNQQLQISDWQNCLEDRERRKKEYLYCYNETTAEQDE